MELNYELHCLADRNFYDDPNLLRKTNPDFSLASEPLPEGWKRAAFDHWLAYLPEDVELPQQGWKIHVASCVDNASEVLAMVARYCFSHTIAFKFVRSPQHLFLANTKYADRGSSGKFIAIYPVDEAQLRQVLEELDAVLTGQPGPYVLSDLRVASGPMYVRYGGFAERWCVGPDGERHLAIETPDGVLVPDSRAVTFRVPEWVTLPACLEPHLAARNSIRVTDMPYEIREALHFSNGGGIYVGYRPGSEQPFILKEGRPHAGLDMASRDAVSRVRWERSILERLTGLDCVPQLTDYFTFAGHEFLVEEFIEGEALNHMIVERYPINRSGPDDLRPAAYAAWALDILGKIRSAVEAIHGRGVVMGDLHSHNIIVRPDGRVVVIDFEGASEAAEGRSQVLANPAFAPPSSLTGVAADFYSLACLRLYMFMPLTELIGLRPAKATELAAAIADQFPVPAEFLSETVTWITGASVAGEARAASVSALLEPDAATWPATAASMATAILTSATPQRDDRLFPGDPMQFAGGALNLAHGAAGVLYSLAAAACGRFPAHEDWLVERALHPRGTPRIGLYEGLHGVAYVLDRLGRRAEARELFDHCHRELRGAFGRLGLDLAAGLAGIGLTLDYFAALTGDPELEDGAAEAVDMVASRLGDEASVPTVSGGEHPYAGLMRGSSGLALLFIRRYQRTGEESLLDLAATALRQDLRRCVIREDRLEVDEGWRTMPYLAQGSVGIGMVLAEYLNHREDRRFSDAARMIRRTAESQFYVQSGLYAGRAGMILYLSHLAQSATSADPGIDDVVAGHIRRLRWYALDYEGHLAFPGDLLLRLSMDLATGTAGVLLALAAALGDRRATLPFFGPQTADPLMVAPLELPALPDLPGLPGLHEVGVPTSPERR